MTATIYNILSFLPLLTLLVLSLWKGVRTGIYVGFVVTTLIFFLMGSEFITFIASLFSAFVGTINILMIIFGAVFLYHIMEQKGYLSGIKDSLSRIHPDRNFRFFFLALFLTAFFESVAGFGTPGAIVPLILISIGFSPVLSIASVLLIDGFFAISGAVGTPVIAGLEIPLDLAPDTIGSVYLYASLAILLSGFLVIFFIYRYLKKETGSSVTSSGWILYLAILVPYVLGSYFLRELTGIIASVIMAVFAYLFLFKEKSFQWRPWLPYILLVLLLLLPKIFPRFGELLSYEMNFSSIYGTGVNASLQPFRSPLIPFLASAAFALYRVKDFRVDLKPVVSKTVAVFLVLFPSLGITQLMLNSGQEMSSMVDSLASVFVRAGNTYPVFSPLIGIIGAFITGSTTVSNIIFGSVQYNAALSLNMQPEIILGLQLAGASLGNAVCLFNIIAAAAVAGISNFKEILRKNLIPVLFTSLICTILGYLLIFLIGG